MIFEAFFKLQVFHYHFSITILRFLRNSRSHGNRADGALQTRPKTKTLPLPQVKTAWIESSNPQPPSVTLSAGRSSNGGKMDGGIIFDEGHKVKGAAHSVSTCARRHWTSERLEGQWRQPGVETDGHVTQRDGER